MSEIGDGLEHLRIPFEKIKFGKKIEGQGYGSVFEGEFDHRRVALKRLNITNLGHIKPKLLAECLTISRFRQHPNLVALLGICDEKNNEIILVYEYVSSGNLADKMRKHLNTIQRLEICLGAARGLDYLHTGVDPTTPGIVHGDIKISKILLNSDSNSSKFQAKVSSFGLSKVLPGQVQKTLDPTDPAYEVTKESDVYSFGVLLLEVLCGVPELVDTDDYQERHVTELVPKRLEQNKLRKIVHFGIRNEIKTESLETYTKIACQCVKKNPEERPTMAQVVEELEKALRLQGGEVSHVQILGSRNIEGASDGAVIEEDGNGVTVDSNILEREPEDAKIVRVEDDVQGKLDLAGEEIRIVGSSSESSNGGDVTMQERSFHVPILDSVDGEGIPESSNNMMMCTNDPEITEEIIDDLNSNETSNITGENEDDDHSRIIAASSESSNGDTGTSDHSVNHEGRNSGILESGSRNGDNLPYTNHDEEVRDKLEHLRIPFEKIKFGKKIDIDGYGSMFEGEFDNLQVALKRLNITNLAHIKPKLLVEILTVARFRQHPNLVALLGFCDEKNDEIILVYEYISSGNLADKMSKHLTTIQRLEICLGAACGLNYLHSGVGSTPGIIHGDIRLSKILLNSDSTSSKFKAKVSSFGLSKVVPGQGQKTPDPTDPAYEVTGTKESDVYSFGVLLLEVLCGVPELVDTDDYQERHVTELVPKRLEQNKLRKIVHFDIRNEIKTESLETYVKIACQCVMKTPEERPTMAQVVKELEKALRLQGGEVFDVQLLGSSNGNGPPEGTVDEDDWKGDGSGETLGSNIAEKESMAKIAGTEEVIDDLILDDRLDLAGDEDRSDGTSSERGNGEKNAAEDITTQGQQSFPVPILGSEDGENLPDITKSTEEIIDDLKSDKESKIIGENKVDNESRITATSSESYNGDGSNSAKGPRLLFPVLGSEDGHGVAERTDVDDAQNEKGNALATSVDDLKSKEDIMNDLNSNEKSNFVGQNNDDKSRIIIASSDNLIEKNTATEITVEVQNSGIVDSGSANAGKENVNSTILNLHDTEKKPEPIINIGGGFDDFATDDKFKSIGKTQESESKRSNSTCSESSNGDGTTPADYLLNKSPADGGTMKTPSNGSRNCCSCAWWRFFSDRVALYGGRFWNKLVSCFTWIRGQFSSKHD